MVIQQHGEFVYVGDAERVGETFKLSRDEAHHLTRVRRKRMGQEIYATDGQGHVYRSMIESPDTLAILEALENFGEPRLHLSLICGCLQGEKSRDVVESAVQLGAREILWTRMEHSQESYGESRMLRLDRVAIQSLKQSGRAYLPAQRALDCLADALSGTEDGILWAAHPGLPNSQELSMATRTRAALVVGPEGGFCQAELELLQQAHARFLELGPRRLRTEVAVATGLSFLLTQAGEFRA